MRKQRIINKNVLDFILKCSWRELNSEIHKRLRSKERSMNKTEIKEKNYIAKVSTMRLVRPTNSSFIYLKTCHETIPIQPKKKDSLKV